MSSHSFSPKFVALLPKSAKPEDLRDSLTQVVGQLEVNLQHHKGTNRRIEDNQRATSQRFDDLHKDLEEFRTEMRDELSRIDRSLSEISLTLAAISTERTTEKAVKARTWALITGAFVFGNAILALAMKLLIK